MGLFPREHVDEPAWPAHEGTVLFLLDAVGPVERRLLEAWVARRAPQDGSRRVDCALIPSARRPPRRRVLDPHLEASLAAGDDPLLVPLRIAWLAPRQAGGERAVTVREILLFGDPRDPGPVRQLVLLRIDPERCRVVMGAPARTSEVRARWLARGGVDAAENTGLSDFVVRQAALALERAERMLRGNRHKVPRFVREEILRRPSFRGAIVRLAAELGRSPAELMREAARDLREMAAAHNSTLIDLAAQLFRAMYRGGYGKLVYDREQLERVAAISARHPVVYLPTHRSNLDHPILTVALYENGLPPNHTAGGINMNFFPLGPIVRRAGVFFIRRSFKSDPVYKLVLRHYIDFLVEKRFALEWYIEGGRSRSGKLLPPRFGLLAYAVDSYRRAHCEDLMLVPVSIAYDQVEEVGDYVAEQVGRSKRPENIGWLVRLLRMRGRRYGDIRLEIGEPLSVRSMLGAPDPTAEPHPDAQSLELQKLAFEVCVRINRCTPITPISLVTLVLLGAGDRALTLDEIRAYLQNTLSYVERRRLPLTGDLDLRSSEGVARAVNALVRNGVLRCFDEGPQAVYLIGPEQHLAAAYYRNSIIHFFVTAAIAELALLEAAHSEGGERLAIFHEEAARVRDLLKFEFFFPEREAFRRELEAEVALHSEDWRAPLAGGREDVLRVLRRFRPFSAHRVARPFLEAYRVVADVLATAEPGREVEEAAFLEDCIALGRQYVLQKRIHSEESISSALFRTALRLARNRKLIGVEDSDLVARRRRFAEQVSGVIRRVDAIEALASARRSGAVV